ncbi:MAG: tRNA (cytosine(32)/uridine(32)-2'-O)-methyltransferase TrmJ [Psychromonas sp.]|nr:tRNA (cytosine(32)/uridine(32)-2'-O)-methyltransferase TrmJ [Psychromonas sp.]
MLENVRIILIGTSHPGNIGSVARAMKTMALSNLALVYPKCAIDEKSLALSAGASDVLNDHKVFSTLEEAVAECGLVIGASARQRTHDWPMLNPREVGDKVVQEASMYPVALVFGRENSGLTNDELQKCHFHVFIPANPDYSSLNLAMAVQILSYEVRMSFLNEIKPQVIQKQYPLAHEIEDMFKHLEEMLIETHFIRVNHPGHVMQKLRRFFAHARPETIELRMWRGIFTNIQKSIISATVEGTE